MELGGRVAIVTGASGRGMGRSIAFTLAREGADVVVNFKERRERAEEVTRAIEVTGRRALAHQADVSDPSAAARMVEATQSQLGQVDIVVLSAGGSWAPRDITDIDPAHWRRVMAEEVDAAYALIRAALPGMRQLGWGRFVLIGGHAADDWRFGPPEAPFDYPLGKAARHWLARTLGPRELEHGITVNAVAPGPTDYISFEEAQRLAWGGEPPVHPTPQDVAEIVVFLCSERARRISGAVVPVVGAREV
jgi:NAD(P)-dependent dehydrogenase (short-subunit alcohol dehydrogenase family)